MAHKTHDLVVKTGSYTDNQGNQKNRYENVGALMMGENGPFLMLKRTFNPAGVLGDRDTVLISAFETKPRDNQQGGYDQSPSGHQAPASGGVDDDEIPF